MMRRHIAKWTFIPLEALTDIVLTFTKSAVVFTVILVAVGSKPPGETFANIISIFVFKTATFDARNLTLLQLALFAIPPLEADTLPTFANPIQAVLRTVFDSAVRTFKSVVTNAFSRIVVAVSVVFYTVVFALLLAAVFSEVFRETFALPNIEVTFSIHTVCLAEFSVAIGSRKAFETLANPFLQTVAAPVAIVMTFRFATIFISPVLIALADSF